MPSKKTKTKTRVLKSLRPRDTATIENFLTQHIHQQNRKRVKQVVDRRKRNLTSFLNKHVNKQRRNQRLERHLSGSRLNVNAMMREPVPYTKAQANRILDQIASQRSRTLPVEDRRYYTASFGDAMNRRALPINANTRRFWFDVLTRGAHVQALPDYGSDAINQFTINDTEFLEVSEYRYDDSGNRNFINQSVAYFPYLNHTDIDLSRYGIYADSVTRENCLIHALTGLGLSNNIVSALKLKIAQDNTCYVRAKHYKMIANMIGHRLKITQVDSKGQKRTAYHGSQDAPVLSLGVYMDHIFINEPSIYTRFSIINYTELLEDRHEEWYDTHSKRTRDGMFNRNSTKPKMSSLDLIVCMYNNGLFVMGNQMDNAESESNIYTRDHIYLDNMENEQRPCKRPEIKRYDPSKTDIHFADTETFVKPVTGQPTKHSLYLLGSNKRGESTTRILNICDYKTDKHENSDKTQLIWDWLNDITRGGKRNALVYYHNSKYDLHIIGDCLNYKDICEKDGQIYSIKCRYKGAEVEIRDSYKLLNWALASFPKNLGLPCSKKEAIDYTYYTRELNDVVVPIEKYSKGLCKRDKDVFKNLMGDRKTFNPTEYYKEYLDLDCRVLGAGLDKFDEIVRKITKDELSIYDCLTISSLTDKFFQLSGAYDGVYECTGNLRKFISGAIYGGRVHVNEKFVKKVIKGKIADYDGVSLYPSAIYRLCQEKGLPKGKAQRLTDVSTWRQKMYSVLKVQIHTVGKTQQMPMITHKGKDSIDYRNTPPPGPITIDSVTLEDWINFHKITYTVLDGVYWDNGGNRKLGELIQNLFDERLIAKKAKQDALQQTLKLMLNSSYGKTIQKPSQSSKSIVNINKSVKVDGKWVTQTGVNFDNYVIKNFNTIISINHLTKNQVEVEQSSVDTSYNRCHIGAMILSYSKRIVNEVFDVANDLGVNVYMSDTDSAHMDFDGVPLVENEFRNRYGKELTGKSLSQFHVDFDLKGSVGDIYATTSIFLGKKSYLDILESVDKDGNTIHGTHVRMKGITPEGLEHARKKYPDGLLGLYTDLAKGNSHEFVLNPYNPDEEKQKVMFEFTKKNGILSVETKKEFKRVVKF